MKTIKVYFDQQIPDDATYEQIQAWLRYKLGEVAMLKNENDLGELAAEWGSTYHRSTS